MLLQNKETKQILDTGDSLGGDLMGTSMLIGPAIYRFFKKMGVFAMHRKLLRWLFSANAFPLYKILLPIAIVFYGFALIVLKHLSFFDVLPLFLLIILFFITGRKAKKAAQGIAAPTVPAPASKPTVNNATPATDEPDFYI